MSKYNLDKYNLSKYNIGGSSSSDEILITMDCHEQLVTTVTFSLNTLIDATGSENLLNNVQATRAIMFGFNLENELGTNIKADLIAVIKTNCLETLNVIVNVFENISGALELEEDLKVDTHLSLNTKFNLTSNERLMTSVFGGADVVTKSIFLNEALMVGVRTSLLNNSIFNLNITLQPGESVEIDSDLFTAYLLDENVLDQYHGDWVNIDRDSIALNVSSGSGGDLEGILIYRERYL